MQNASTFVGLDVHKNSIVIALLRPGQSEPLERKVANEPGAVQRLIRKLMSYPGRVPRESSSGMRERRGGITGAGNRHVRRLMVEAAWHYRHKPVVGRALRLRRREQDPKAIALADRALRRLTLRQRRMLYQGKHPNLVNIAVARELVGFVWNVLHTRAKAQA